MAVTFHWPLGFDRVPDEDWTRVPVETLARRYDTVENHGWYANLDPTVASLAADLRAGDVVIDYSGGTGILAARLLARRPHVPFGVCIVDSSPKFLRLALEKFRDEPRIAFRLLRWRKEEKRLDYVDECVGSVLAERRADALVSTNAVHLYQDLSGTFRAWARVLRGGGRVYVQSGNVRNPAAPSGRWIIDDTVAAVHREALRMAREDARCARWRDAAEDMALQARHDAYRERVFMPARPLAAYVDALRGAGLEVLRVEAREVKARTAEWLEFLSVYHEAILGWVGGIEKVEGRAPDASAVADRLDMLGRALERVVEGREVFEATWTYIDARRP
ncbi:MAG TPA: class I SAM-dependent methyltransferase [Candidatus Thermoplasmatota archaeon]|nr:class I SAM-dependent methyltransferase [Candidatus Thermoplasmatota archaeon]